MSLQSILNKNFQSILKSVGKVSRDTHLMFHPKRTKLNMNSFDGFNNCGPLCLSVLDLLSRNNIEGKIKRCVIGLEDHVYIELKDNTIIDPSYKQFLRDTRGVDDLYQEILYDKLSDYYIGSKEELLLTFKTMCDLNKLIYKENHIDYNDITYFYDRPYDITEKFNSSLHLVN